MTFSRFFRQSAAPSPAEALYLALVRQARQPAFYAGLGVPDSLDGRFDMVALHMALLLLRLKAEGAAGEALAQALFDIMFADMDRSLREMGVGDLGVGKRVKDMAAALYGRAAAYETGLQGADAMLEAAVARNLYGTAAPSPGAASIATMARYVRQAAASLAAQPLTALAAGRIELPAPELPAA